VSHVYLHKYKLPASPVRIKTLRLQLRFLAPLAVVFAAVAYVSLPLIDNLMLRWAARDLALRGTLVANAMSDSITDCP